MKWFEPSTMVSNALYVSSTMCVCAAPFLDGPTQITVFTVAIMMFGIGWLIRRFDIFKL